MDSDIIYYPVKTPLKTRGQILLELADKAGKYNLALFMLRNGIITMKDFLMYEQTR